MLDDTIRVDLKRALFGGALAAAVMGFGVWLTNSASGIALDGLLRELVPNARSFAGTVVLASATILALMLTLLGTSASSDSRLKAAHYIRIRQVALGDTIVFVSAMTLDLLLNIPLSESSEIGSTMQHVVYYGTLGLTSLLGGALVAIVLMIYNTVTDMIEVLALHKEDHPLYADDDADDDDAVEE